MNESWLNAPLKDGRVGMSKTITVRRSELGTLRMAAGNERKYNKIADLAPDCEAYKPNAHLSGGTPSAQSDCSQVAGNA
jgi:hypothetical protein